MRRARGYVPTPIDLKFNVDGILATGAELSNAFCLGKKQQAIFSQHIGDLKNAETYEFYRENIHNFKQIYRFAPDHVACDLHPDYLSTRFAIETDVPVTQVQHHHAHIAAIMAEYGLSKKIIGLAYDGTGYGTDGHTWGSELLVSDLHGFERQSHFEYIPLPGGDKVTKEPWRTGISYLYRSFGKEWNKLDIPLLHHVDRNKAELLIEAIDKNINCPLSCSAGRLFDAVAAILGICTESNYHAEAPQLLENYLTDGINEEYPLSVEDIISFTPMIKEIVIDFRDQTSLDEIVTKFHNTIIKVAYKQVKYTSEIHKIKQVALGGGSFQNKYLTEKLLLLLRQDDFEVYFPEEVSCNDGGIALGQMAVAAHKK
jgi:hydrogenase maturation protein HypF